MRKLSTSRFVEFGPTPVTIEDICNLADGKAKAKISTNKKWQKKIDQSANYLAKILKDGGTVYGVTTGYGESCTVDIPPSLMKELPAHLTRFHGCGLGDYFTVEEGLAIMATRLASLTRGVSGIRLLVLQRIADLMNKQIVPVIPQEGSVGASGDLTPLSYLAAVLLGDREVYFKGHVSKTATVYSAHKIKELQFLPKEALALMNGTSVMTAIACLAYRRAAYLSQLTARITALVLEAVDGNEFHFDQDLFDLKPHPGQNIVAKRIRGDLKPSIFEDAHRIQDRYSIRCAPHVIGVLEDSLPWVRQFIEIELNSANDNPLIDGEKQKVMHGGHFYGGHIAFAMDSMKVAIANLADLMDRQLALMMDQAVNRGLPRNLSGAKGERKLINHGLKAVQIGVSAWTAEALKNTMPASVFSRSTESHNQDKVSMGTIAARDCLRVLQLTEQVAAAMLVATHQALRIRIREKEIIMKELKPSVIKMLADLKFLPFIEEDMPLDKTLRDLIEKIQHQQLDLYE